MEDQNLTEIIKSALHFHSHNSSYAMPGYYDIKIEDAIWAMSATLIFFTMQTGMALMEVGVISKKHQANVMMKNIVDMCAGGLAFWTFGFGLMYGRGEYTNPFFGFGDFFVNAEADDPLAGQVFTWYFFQLAFATSVPSFVSGAVAERFKFSSYILFSFSMTLVYSIGAGWLWGEHGILKNIGAIDFSGAAPIHIIAGAGCK
jgi:ammonium transporter, Amt family